MAGRKSSPAPVDTFAPIGGPLYPFANGLGNAQGGGWWAVERGDAYELAVFGACVFGGSIDTLSSPYLARDCSGGQVPVKHHCSDVISLVKLVVHGGDSRDTGGGTVEVTCGGPRCRGLHVQKARHSCRLFFTRWSTSSLPVHQKSPADRPRRAHHPSTTRVASCRGARSMDADSDWLAGTSHSNRTAAHALH